MNNLLSFLGQLKANPASFLQARGIQIPQGMTDPNAILDQMVSSGQYSQAQINAAYQQGQQLQAGAQAGSFVNNSKGI